MMKILYGPLEYEPEKMTIIVGSLVCQFNETKINYNIEDHIAEHDTAIENVLLEQNRTNEIIFEYSEKLDDLETKLEEHSGKKLSTRIAIRLITKIVDGNDL